jgi:hypothetical protein
MTRDQPLAHHGRADNPQRVGAPDFFMRHQGPVNATTQTSLPRDIRNIVERAIQGERRGRDGSAVR